MFSKGKENSSLLAIPNINICSPVSSMKDLIMEADHSQQQSDQNYIDKISIYSSVVKNPQLQQKSQNIQKKMKLKDYILLKNISSARQTQRKRRIDCKISRQSNQINGGQPSSSQSQVSLRRPRKNIQNDEMLQFLKKEISNQLQDIKNEIGQLKNIIINTVSSQNPTQDEMIMMYQFRSLIKEQLSVLVQKMKRTLMAQVKNTDEKVEEQIIVEELRQISFHKSKEKPKKKAKVHFNDQT